MAKSTDNMSVCGEVPEALPGRIILKFSQPKEEEQVRDSGLIIPAGSDTAKKEEKFVAEVIHVGDGTDRAEEMFCKIVRPGMYVIANRNYGEDFAVENEEGRTVYHILRHFEIIGLLPARKGNA